MGKQNNNGLMHGSFRDPSGFLFCQDGLIYRQVNTTYRENYDYLMNSGLYKALVNAELLIPHEETSLKNVDQGKAYRVIKPEMVPFISYPYEWCFSQLKDAALLTLKVQKKALEYGMSLKDSSAYNIQFLNGKPILIDTLSFEMHRKDQPWVAYRQFCQHFLAPLALMNYKDIRLSQLLRIYIDGIPLDLASLLLPARTKLNIPLLLHIHFHAKSGKYFSDKPLNKEKTTKKFTTQSMLGLIDNLESCITNLKWRTTATEWGDYYDKTNYSTEAFTHKKEIISGFLDKIQTGTVWDLGANTGLFSRLASKRGMQTLAFDIDPVAVEANYQHCVKGKEKNILPLLLDLTNPSPAIGWENEERASLIERGPADIVLALALIHHLAISNNLPFIKIADFFSKICDTLIIEFIPKHDSQIQKLLSSRDDVFAEYNQECFERDFNRYFTVENCIKIKDSARILYLMRCAKT